MDGLSKANLTTRPTDQPALKPVSETDGEGRSKLMLTDRP